MEETELSHGRGVEKECDRLLGIITSQIPDTQIQDYTGLKELILSGLESRGYLEESPECELRTISQSESHFEYGIFLDAESRNPLFSDSIMITGPMNSDAVIDGMSAGLREGNLNIYNIINVDGFLAELADWLREYIPSPDEESVKLGGWTVTLSLDVESEEIEWVARQGMSESRRGVMYTSPEEFRQLGQEAACEEVRRLFGAEVIPILLEITNLDELLEEQIPDIVQEIILGPSE